MSLQLAFAQAAGGGPQPPTTPLKMMPLSNAPNIVRDRAYKLRKDCGIAKRRLSKDRWLITSNGDPIGRVKRVVRRSELVRRIFMEHGRHKDIVDFDAGLNEGKCAETGAFVRVRVLMM